MPRRITSSRLYFAAAGVLLAIYFLQGAWASTRKSPAFDETGDIAAGLSYVQYLDVRANLQHPPLMKELSGAALWLTGVRLRDTPTVRRMLGGGGGEREAGSELLAAAGVDRTLLLARLPLLACSTLLGLLVFVWCRELAGDIAAIAALLLYTLDPNVMAQGYLVTMDMGLAAFAMLFLYTLWRYTQAPDTRRLIWCGIAMGLMLAAKFSAVFLLPVAAVLLLVASRGRGGYRWAVRAFLLQAGIAAVVVQVVYLSPGGLYLYKAGMASVNQDHNPNYLVYLGGQLEHNFAGYFAVAWLLKEPLATLLLGAIGLWALGRKKYPMTTRLYLALPPAAILAAHMLFADDLGVRYILPALPFAHLAGGIGAAWLVADARRWGRAAALALGVWLAVGAVAVYPDQLSYFNEAACLPSHAGWVDAAGGTRCGPLWLDDSNVDWGQGLKQLSEWVAANAKGRPLRLAYFGSFPPENYLPGVPIAGIDELMNAPKPGLYAVSGHFVARMQAMPDATGVSGGSWLARMSPAAIVGHAFYVYQVSK